MFRIGSDVSRGLQYAYGRNPSIPNDSASRANSTDVANVWKVLRRMATTQDKIRFRICLGRSEKRVPLANIGYIGRNSTYGKRKENEEMCSAFEKVLVDQNIFSTFTQYCWQSQTGISTHKHTFLV
jgi:hypothetical protein